MKRNQLSPSEALYGFMAWLTTRKKRVCLSSGDEAGQAAELVKAFCEINGLDDPKKGWIKRLTYPDMGR